ncbi:hypothetical protein EDB92DRAFT_1818260 [Lactarius akahatsu]|uniref:Uncharacterized protein n=1 Tax=Lactarius akahatsu TaxID=416441 RepID=A0AAD4QBD0_9AGAM|nr:hypothetical protein EDB92DRAFT_1818260 [Lactarius akahatsu]
MVAAHAHPLCHYSRPLSLFWASVAGGFVSYYDLPIPAILNTRANRRADLRRLVARFGNNVDVFNTQGGHFISSGDPIDANYSHKSASAISQHDSVTSRSSSGSVRAEIMLDAIRSSAELWSTDTEICGLYVNLYAQMTAQVDQMLASSRRLSLNTSTHTPCPFSRLARRIERCLEGVPIKTQTLSHYPSYGLRRFLVRPVVRPKSYFGLASSTENPWTIYSVYPMWIHFGHHEYTMLVFAASSRPPFLDGLNGLSI